MKNILTPEAKEFLQALHRKFNPLRLNLLQERQEIQNRLDNGWNPELIKTKAAEDLFWKGALIPKEIERRFVEITGPVERKMMINALNSGADIFMADFEDSLSPTWDNVIQGQLNLMDAVRKTLSFTSSEGKEYRLNENLAVLFVRPRGWHLDEKHYAVDGELISASLFDFGLYFFHNAKELLKRGTAPYFYLPKLENDKEAALWNDVFKFAEKQLGIEKPVIKATVLIETILAAFCMEEIIFSLKDYCIGLNAGRWDYIFSVIKKFSSRNFTFPDRSQITMTVPFMKAYQELLVHICHKREVFAMGGMSAFVPSRKDLEINEQAFDQVKKDKLREVEAGFDGTWVAHPDLVPIARDVFEGHLKERPNQIFKKSDLKIRSKDLLNFEIPRGKVTDKGILQNITVALLYLKSWLNGTGAVTIHHLMEDAATAEISRSQLWQWLHHGAQAGILELLKQEADKSEELHVPYVILKKLIEDKQFIDFLTVEAYKYE